MKRSIAIIISFILLIGITSAAGPTTTTISIEDSNETNRSVVSINDIRKALGIEDLFVNETLNKMTLNHSKYMHYNDALTSIEESDLLYFRGRYPWDRADYYEYNKDFIYEFVKKDFTSYMEAYLELQYDPVSRYTLLNPMYTDIGINHYESYLTYEFGGNTLEIEDAVIYPYNGQDNVPITWQGELLDIINEDPNISVEQVGLPITYAYYGENISYISTQKLSITNKTLDEPIKFSVIEPNTKYQLKNTLTLIPFKPYEYNTTYEVTMDFTVFFEDGSSRKVNEVNAFSTKDFTLKTVESKYVTRASFTESVMKTVMKNIYPKKAFIEPLESRFSDVALGDSSTIYIHSASELDIINGYSDGRFGPDDNITKQQAYKILIDAYKHKNKTIQITSKDALKDYSDYEEIASWALDNIIIAKELGILLDKNNQINPNDYITESEFEEIMTVYEEIME